jgi:hypothetical protein
MKTIKDWAQDSLFAMDACNLSGIVHSFSRFMTDIRSLEPERGTEYYNTHPIAQMFATKIIELTRMGLADTEQFTKTYHAINEMLK